MNSQQPQVQCLKLTVNKNQQESLPINEQPTQDSMKRKSKPEIVEEALNAHHLDAEITDSDDKVLSSSAEIVEKCTESDTSEISEKSASILQSKPEQNTDEDKTGLMNKDVVKDQNEVSAPSNIP